MFRSLFSRLFASSLSSILSNLDGLVVKLDAHAEKATADAAAVDAKAEAVMVAAKEKYDRDLAKANEKFDDADSRFGGLIFKAERLRYEAEKAVRVSDKVKALVA